MPKDLASPQAKSNSLEQAFRDAEASLLLEGLDPTKDSRYRAIKAQVIAGTMTFDEAEAAIDAEYGDGVTAGKAFSASASA
jgi:Flp pilus assembly protein TadD